MDSFSNAETLVRISTAEYLVFDAKTFGRMIIRDIYDSSTARCCFGIYSGLD